MFGLEALVLMKEVVVQAGGEDRVDFLSQVYLCHLKFGQTVGNHGVLEVGAHQLLKKLHVFGRELPHALVDQSSHFWVTDLFFLKHCLNVILDVAKTRDQLLHVLQHYSSVREDLLVLDQVTNCVLRDVTFVIQNGDGVEVLLAIEEHIQTCLRQVLEIKLVGQLTENRTVLEEK